MPRTYWYMKSLNGARYVTPGAWYYLEAEFSIWYRPLQTLQDVIPGRWCYQVCTYRTKSSLQIDQYSCTPGSLYCWLVQGRLQQHDYRHTNSTHRPSVNVA